MTIPNAGTEGPPSSFLPRFALIAAAFALLFVVSWPIVYSFDLWVLFDRGNFLNLDYLLAQNLKLGVDTTYTYGLLPVLIQHLLFLAFGRGYEPMLAANIVYALAMAAFWALLLRHMARSWKWLASVILMSPILLWVNPNFPYCLVLLSIFFAILLVLEGKNDWALAVAAVGCFSVASTPLALVCLLVALIFFQWAISANRQLARLFRMLAPGFVTFATIAAILVASFGWESFVATVFPFKGMQYYKSVHAGQSVFTEFLFPGEVGIFYYVANRAGWWMLSTLALAAFAFRSAIVMVKQRRPEPVHSAIFICAALHFAYALLAYGPPNQHIIYDPMLVIGVLLGLSSLPAAKLRARLLLAFVLVAVVAQASQVRDTVNAWRNTKPAESTAHLYATRAFAAEWEKVLNISRGKKLLLLSYGTGVHHYFPAVQSPDLWFLHRGLVGDADKQRLLQKMQAVEVVVQYLGAPTSFVDADPDLQRQLNTMCLKELTPLFQIWWREGEPSPSTAEIGCKPNPRNKTLLRPRP